MARIGVFDSGAGGLSVLRELLKLIPDAEYIYYADNANCPYGSKSPEFITDRARAITEILISKGADIIVVACNTATSVAIATLRSEYDIPFVGMEPAVKPAALDSRTKVIGVLATEGTLRSSKYSGTKEKFGAGVRIVEQVGKGFVELVEKGELEGPHAEEVCMASLRPILEAGADRIVLGCTHYPFLLPVLEKLAGNPDVVFINPAPSVARRTLQLLGDKKAVRQKVELLSSGSDEILRRIYGTILYL